MENKKAYSGRAVSMPSGLMIGAVISMMMTIGLSAIVAKFVEAQILQPEQIGYSIIVLLLLSSFFGAKMAYWRVKHRKTMVCFLSGIIYIGGLLSITALFFGGQYEAVGVTCAVILAGSLCAALLGTPVKTAGKGRKRKRVRC